MESIKEAADNLPADKFEKADLTDKEKSRVLLKSRFQLQ